MNKDTDTDTDTDMNMDTDFGLELKYFLKISIWHYGTALYGLLMTHHGTSSKEAMKL